MVSSLLKSFALRIFLPLSLLFAACLRPSFISVGYVVIALICPVLPQIRSTHALPAGIRVFLLFTFAYSLLCALCQTAYQIYEPIQRSEQIYKNNCNATDVRWWKYSGFLRFHGGDGLNSAKSILPEIISITVSLISLVFVAFLSHREEELDVVGSIQPVRSADVSRLSGSADRLNVIGSSLKRFSNVLIIVITALVGCVQPSLLNFVYFAAFLFVSTWWSLYKPLRHGAYNHIKRFLVFFIAVHFVCIYSYQIPLVQDWLGVGSLTTRLIGLSRLLVTSCDSWWNFDFAENLEWPAFVNPLSLLVLYYALLLQLFWTQDGTRHYMEDDPSGSSVHEERCEPFGTQSTFVGRRTSSEGSQSPSNARPRGNTMLLPAEESAGENVEPSAIPLRKVTSQTVDRHKIQQMIKGERAVGVGDNPAKEGLVAIFFFFLSHAYAFALLAMMTWALLYHSIFGLILLVTTCILWMFKDTRNAAFVMSPALVAYVEFLLVVQYICSMDLTNAELNIKDWMKMMGIELAADMEKAFVTLTVKILLSLPVFLLLRLRLRERFYDSLTDHERSLRVQTYGTFSSNPDHPATSRSRTGTDPYLQRGQNAAAVFHWLSHQLTAYWIFVVAFVLLIVGLQNHPVIYSIGYFAIFALCVFYFKISLCFFRGISYLFWLSTIIYTSVVIISLYVYQFPGFPDVWIRWTKISKEWNDDIGLINYASTGDKGSLVGRLVGPISLFVVTMLQLKFFHNPWSQMVQPGRNPNVEEQEPTEITLTQKLVKWTNSILELVWRTTEVHVDKIVFMIMAIYIANNICALYLPLMLLISLALCLPNRASAVLSLVMCAYLSLVAIFKMIYQLNHIPDFGIVNVGEVNCSATTTLAEWLGVRKEANTSSLVNGLVVSIVALGIQSVVIYRQRHYRIQNGEPEESKNRIFPHFEMHDFDKSLWCGIKFLVDYGFYKFGFEITMGMMAIDAWVRMDMLAAVMCIWLAFFALNKRNVARSSWPLFVLYLAILLPVQFAMYVGLPEDRCIQYPWSSLFHKHSNGTYDLVQQQYFDIWASLADYKVKWPPKSIIADFFLLLFAACQMTVFRTEKDENDSIYPDGSYYFKPENPHYDFISKQKSFIDYVKLVIFHYGHWFTLGFTLVAGIGGTSLFALGYIVLTFWILWQGTNLYVMNAQTNSFKATLKRWNIILAYTLFAMFLKVALQVVGCVFLESLVHSSTLCTIRQLLSITCANSIIVSRSYPTALFPEGAEFAKACPVDIKEAQVGYDAIALIFLVFQIRAFHSWFFQHCMVEYRSEVLMANRGAVLKNQLIEKEMKEQNYQQQDKFDEIRKRTQAIRERYNKQLVKGQGAFEPETYGQAFTPRTPVTPANPWYGGTGVSIDDPLPGYNPQTLSEIYPAKRAGDYYMFDYDPSADELVEPVESFVPESDPEATQFDKLDPGQLVYAAASKDLNVRKTLEAVEEAEKIKDSERRMIEALKDLPAVQEVVADVGTSEGREEPAVEESKIVSVLKFLRKITVNGMDMISVFLNKTSREHRYVSFVLQKEKEKIKEGETESLSNTSLKLTEIRSRMNLSSLQLVHSESDIMKMESEAETDWKKKSAIARLLAAIGSSVAANTDLLCYFLAVIVHATGAGLITLPLPLMVFLWGTLSNPRPSKFFWVVMIAYTEFVIVVKFILQFQFFAFNKTENTTKNAVNPLSLDKVFGVQTKGYFAFWDVLLLFALFFHRYMLRKLGLWKDANLTVTFSETTGEDNGGLTMETIHSRSNSDVVVDPALTATENDLQVAEEDVQDTVASEKSTNPIVRFIQQLFKPKFRYIRDLYPLMFGLDVIAFLIITFGYSGFGEGGSGSVIGDIQQSRIPLTLVIMLIVMTLMIVIDRGLYLRKWVYGKLAYQLIIVVFLHVWIFFVLPELTRKDAQSNGVAQFLYIVKCLYLLVSAWQIRNGYPQLCIGNLITHGYGLANMVFFKVFMAVPFLFELRTAIDWTWTDTSMPLFDFFNMENFYSVIYNLKCARTFEGNYPAPRGQPKGVIVKYFMGLPMILVIVLLVWSPLLAFSLLNQIGDISIPNRVKLSMSLEGYPPLYQIEAQGEELRPFLPNESKYLTEVMSRRYEVSDPESIKRSRQSVAFLKDYTDNDILVVEFRPEAEIFWPISDESLKALKEQLLTPNSSLNFQVAVEFSRPYDAKKKTSEKHATSWDLNIVNDTSARQKIVDALDGKTDAKIALTKSFPSYMLIPNEGQVSIPSPIVESILFDDPSRPAPNNSKENRDWFDELTLNIETTGAGITKVWVAQATHPTDFSGDVFFNSTNTKYGSGRNYIQTVAFVDRAYPSFFAKYLQGGVITMYITVVIVVGRLIRGIFTSSPTDVMISEIPNPDYLLKICLDIYLVREAKDFFLEQDLFAKLIFLFRSPATLIQWTRYKVKND